MNLKSISSIILLIAGLIIAGPVKSQDPMVIDEIICKVDNYIILKSELERAYLDFMSRGQSMDGDVRCKILESLIVSKVMVAKAEIDSVVVEEEQVEQNLDNRIQYILAQVGGDEASIEEFYGKSLASIKDDLRQDIKEQMVAQNMQDVITADVTVTPSEVKKFFNNIPKDSLPYYSAEVSVGQIIKIPELSKSQAKEVTDLLIKIRDEVLGGADFGALARKYSQDPGSANKGGEYGWIKRGVFAPEYEAVAFELEPGEVSMPIKTDFGFHIVQLLERRGNEYRSRHILIRPEYGQADIDRAANFLDSLKKEIIAENITFEVAAKDFSDDKESAASGGLILDASGVDVISVEDLDPVIFMTIDTMKIGNMSPPIPYRLEDGSQAVRIIFYKKRIKPHQASLHEDYQKIYLAALNRKKAELLNKWFIDSKQEVFIDLDKDYDYCDLMN